MKINTDKFVEMMSKRLETNASLAKKTKMSPATISNIRNGRDVRPSNVKKLVEALECTVEDLL